MQHTKATCDCDHCTKLIDSAERLVRALERWSQELAHAPAVCAGPKLRALAEKMVAAGAAGASANAH